MKNTIVGMKTTIADLFVALDRKCSSVSGICFNDKIIDFEYTIQPKQTIKHQKLTWILNNWLSWLHTFIYLFEYKYVLLATAHYNITCLLTAPSQRSGGCEAGGEALHQSGVTMRSRDQLSTNHSSPGPCPQGGTWRGRTWSPTPP